MSKNVVEGVRRVPEVVEFYHWLMRREPGGGLEAAAAAAAVPQWSNSRDMIGEIKNRSVYSLAIKTDVETKGDFIRMLETGLVSQIKLASVKLAMKYMKRVSAELESVTCGSEEVELIVRGVKFAICVHQFAGGFDAETMNALRR